MIDERNEYKLISLTYKVLTIPANLTQSVGSVPIRRNAIPNLNPKP